MKTKKEEWDDLAAKWKHYKAPIRPSKTRIKLFEKYIRKYVKGKKALVLGATPGLRDLLHRMGFNVTVVDINPLMIKAMGTLCKENVKEKVVVGNWLRFKSKEKFDLIVGDAPNFQFKTKKEHVAFYKKMHDLLKPDGYSMQILMVNFLNKKWTLKQIIDKIKKNPEFFRDYKKKAYAYLAYLGGKGAVADCAKLEGDLLKKVKEGEITEKQRSLVNLNFGRFVVLFLDNKDFRLIVKRFFKICEETYENHITDKSFYRLFVLKPYA